MKRVDELKYPEIIRELYQEYYIKDRSDGREYSSHWKKFSKLFDVSIDERGYCRCVGHGFGDFGDKKIWHRLTNALTIASYLRGMDNADHIRSLMRYSGAIVKTFSTYLSYEAFRQLCALSVFRKYLSYTEQDMFNVLCIGDGYGFLSAMIRTLYPRSRIMLVDIGSTLLFQSLNLQIAFPDAVHVLIPSDKSAEADFVYCRAEDTDMVSDRMFSLIVNISSMQEMNMESVNSYFSFVRRTAMADNIFYCSNRELKVLPGGERLEYSKYPWLRDDKILLDGCPGFYKYRYYHKPPFKRYFDPMRQRVVQMAIT